MYDDEPYDDELDYGDEMSQDEEDNPSDEDDEELDEMGEIEGLSGEPGVVEVVMGEGDDDEDEDMDEDDDEEPSDEDEEEDEDEMGSEDMEDMEDRIEIIDEEGLPLDDDGNSGWESDTDEQGEDDGEDIDFEAEAQEIHDALRHSRGLDQLGHVPDILRAVVEGEDLDGEDMGDLDEHYIDDGDEDGEFFARESIRGIMLTGQDEEEDDGEEDEEVYYDHGHLRTYPSRAPHISS